MARILSLFVLSAMMFPAVQAFAQGEFDGGTPSLAQDRNARAALVSNTPSASCRAAARLDDAGDFNAAVRDALDDRYVVVEDSWVDRERTALREQYGDGQDNRTVVLYYDIE